jgi:hypothetical protein
MVTTFVIAMLVVQNVKISMHASIIEITVNFHVATKFELFERLTDCDYPFS